MNKKILLFVSALVLSFATYGQADKGKRMERLQKFKKAYLKKQLALSDAAYTKFAKVYDDYEAKTKTAYQAYKKVVEEVKANMGSFSDGQAKSKLNELKGLKVAILKVRKERSEEFAKILSSKEHLKLELAEMRFRNRLLKFRRGKGGKKGKAMRDQWRKKRKGKRKSGKS